MANLIRPGRRWTTTARRGLFSFTFLLLLIEFFDELHYGIYTASMPVLRADLGLTYAQAGLLLGLPAVLAGFIEPVLMLLGDTRLRKPLVIGGGLAVAGSAWLLASARRFPTALIAMIIAYPASGAFVSLSQATLMDRNPGREAQMMARWTVFGTLGNLVGPLVITAGYAWGFGWRSSYLLIAGMALALVIPTIFARFGGGRSPASLTHDQDPHTPTSSRPLKWAELLSSLGAVLRRPRLLRWLALLQFADLLLDVHLSYSALYFADVAGLSPGEVGRSLSALMAADLVGTLALIPLLERVPGRRLVRITAPVAGLLLAASLMAPWPWVKVALAMGVRLSTLGWYEVLQGEAYAAAPGRSGAVMALTSLAGLLGGGLVWSIGLAAEAFGLASAMGLLLAGPLALLLFMPGEDRQPAPGQSAPDPPAA